MVMLITVEFFRLGAHIKKEEVEAYSVLCVGVNIIFALIIPQWKKERAYRYRIHAIDKKYDWDKLLREIEHRRNLAEIELFRTELKKNYMANGKIVKSFGSKSTYELELGGTRSFVSWERLKEYVGQAVGLSGSEFVEGLIADENGLNVAIGRRESKGSNRK